MLTIDGSYGEGGGQLVRNAVALSAITGEPVTIDRIRAGRDKPGLAAQHLAAVKAVMCACDADVNGISPGSSSLVFVPDKLKSCSVIVDVGTAGSIPLVIQSWLSVALRAGGSLRVTGGTEVRQSPTIDYLENVLAEVLRSAGAEITIDILKRGYYPEGGGDVLIDVKKRSLSPIEPGSMQESGCGIISCSSNLPPHVADRHASSAAGFLRKEGISCGIWMDERIGASTGSSCTIWRGAKGGTALGKRGVPAERIGEIAAKTAVNEFASSGIVDTHLSDQLLVPVALFGGTYTAAHLTSHAETTLWLLEKFGFDVQFHQGSVAEFSA